MSHRKLPEENLESFRRSGLRLLQEGASELARIEATGIRIDVPRLQKTRELLAGKIKNSRGEIEKDPLYRTWRKRFGAKFNLESKPQLAYILFDVLKVEPSKFTDSGKPAVDDEVRQSIDHPFVRHLDDLFRYGKTLNTFLKGIETELVKDRIHPHFNLDTVKSFRSCIAKGTYIEIVRDVSKNPKGIKIENVKAGDLAYCYDENLRLTIKRVLWAGKTGHRKVIRVHWTSNGGHGQGYVDLTPEHEIRIRDGSYVRADSLVQTRKTSVLAMGRTGKPDKILETGTPEPIHDSHLVFKTMIGPLRRNEIVHHKDRNHLNNNPENLEKTTPSEHSRYHALKGDTLTDEIRKKGSKTRQLLHRMFGNRWRKGPESDRWVPVSKFRLLREFSKAGGGIKHMPFQYELAIDKAEFYNIDLIAIKDRYDSEGKYISKGRLKSAFDGSLQSVHNAFRINHGKAQRLLKQRGLIGNRIRNHRITHIEEIEQIVDVYDLEIEDCQNFIANEICVHNSSNNPNFQNYPVRNKDIALMIRSLFIASQNAVLAENDFKGIEVGVSAAYHKDENFISYITTPGKDMHRDMAAQIYCLEPSAVSKDARYGAKNKFVFPQFYGDYYIQCARNCWDWIDKGKLKGPNDIPLKEHLRKKGIKELGDLNPEEEPRTGTFERHMQKIEHDFWNRRFGEYGAWRKQFWADYQDKGYFDILSGFRIEGIFRRNQVTNFPVQGAAFHCLLWSLIQITRELRKYKMRSRIVGQIHDSLLGDIQESELHDYLGIVHDVVAHRLRKHFTWLNVPLEIEYEICPPGEPWSAKREYKFKDGKYLIDEEKNRWSENTESFFESLKNKGK